MSLKNMKKSWFDSIIDYFARRTHEDEHSNIMENKAHVGVRDRLMSTAIWKEDGNRHENDDFFATLETTPRQATHAIITKENTAPAPISVPASPISHGILKEDVKTDKINVMVNKKNRKVRSNDTKLQVLPGDAESNHNEVVASNMPAVAYRSPNFFSFLQYYHRPEIPNALLDISDAGTYFIHARFLPTAIMFEATIRKSEFTAAELEFRGSLIRRERDRETSMSTPELTSELTSDDVNEQMKSLKPEVLTTNFVEEGTTGVWYHFDQHLMLTGEGTRNLEELLRKDWCAREPHLKPRPSLNDLHKLNKTDFNVIRPLGSFGSIQLFYVQFIKKEDELQADLPEFGFMKKVPLKASGRYHLNLMNEALLQEFVAGPHVVKIIGSCYFNGTAIFTETGLFSLQCCLRANRGKLGQAVKLRWSIEAAEALVHLQQRRYLHRNVRSTSFFLTNDFTLKLGNFEYADYIKCMKSVSQCFYDYDMSLARYLPPETVIHKVYTIESEVWSYGVLVWEIYSKGKEPHAEMTDHKIKLKWRKEGRTLHKNKHFRLKMPWKCPGDVVGMIEQCWIGCTCCKERPSISDILKKMKEAYKKWMLD